VVSRELDFGEPRDSELKCQGPSQTEGNDGGEGVGRGPDCEICARDFPGIADNWPRKCLMTGH